MCSTVPSCTIACASGAPLRWSTVASLPPQVSTSIANSPLVSRSASPQRMRPAICPDNFLVKSTTYSRPRNPGIASSRRPAAYGVEAIFPFHFGLRTSVRRFGMSTPLTRLVLYSMPTTAVAIAMCVPSAAIASKLPSFGGRRSTIAPHSTDFSACCLSPSNSACALPMYKSVLAGCPAAFSCAMRTIKACMSGPGVNWPFTLRPYFLFMPARKSLKPSPPPKVFCDHCARRMPSFFAPSIICASVALAPNAALDEQPSRKMPNDNNRACFSRADIYASFRCRGADGIYAMAPAIAKATLYGRARAEKTVCGAAGEPSFRGKNHDVGGIDPYAERSAVDVGAAALRRDDAIGQRERQQRLVAQEDARLESRGKDVRLFRRGRGQQRDAFRPKADQNLRADARLGLESHRPDRRLGDAGRRNRSLEPIHGSEKFRDAGCRRTMI